MVLKLKDSKTRWHSELLWGSRWFWLKTYKKKMKLPLAEPKGACGDHLPPRDLEAAPTSSCSHSKAAEKTQRHWHSPCFPLVVCFVVTMQRQMSFYAFSGLVTGTLPYLLVAIIRRYCIRKGLHQLKVLVLLLGLLYFLWLFMTVNSK